MTNLETHIHKMSHSSVTVKTLYEDAMARNSLPHSSKYLKRNRKRLFSDYLGKEKGIIIQRF